jgi:hypothetical protein
VYPLWFYWSSVRTAFTRRVTGVGRQQSSLPIRKNPFRTAFTRRLSGCSPTKIITEDILGVQEKSDEYL